MQKINKVVWQETAYISIWTVILSVLMESVFLIIGKWELSVLFGNLYCAVAVILNFFLLGLTVQKAVDKEEKDAKQFIKMSQTLRLLFLVVVAIVGAVLKCFNTWTVLITLFFPRIALLFRAYFKIGADAENAASNKTDVSETEIDADNATPLPETAECDESIKLAENEFLGKGANADGE